MENVVDIKSAANNSIKLTYKTLNSEGFNQTLATLANQTGFGSFDAIYNVAKIVRQFSDELRIARETYAKWTKPLLVTEEDGTFKRAEKPHPLCPWEIKADMTEEFNKQMDEFLKTEVTLNAKPLTFEDIGKIQLTPAQLINLEPIFDPYSFAVPKASQH